MRNEPDLATRYLGLELSSPLVASSCPLTGDIAAARALEDAGVGAIVLPSLFQEQIEHDEHELALLSELGAGSFHEAGDGYFPELLSYNTGPDGYLELVGKLRSELSIPVIASLNGISIDGWRHYVGLVQEAGAHAVELNTSFVPTDPSQSSAEVEQMLVDQVAAVAAAVEIPVAVKLGPHLTAPAHLATRLRQAGAEGLVLFNRFLEPDLDLEALEVVPRLELSRPAEMRMPLRWIAILSARTDLSLASTSGVHGADDALKSILAGADAVMVASGLLRHGPGWARTVLDGMRAWMREHEYVSVRQMRGSMNHRNCPNPAGYERLNYMKALMSFTGSMV